MANSENCVDEDGDGFFAETPFCPSSSNGTDCNDDPNAGGYDIRPGRDEDCETPQDDNCNGLVNCEEYICRQNDEECEEECDLDGDGYFSPDCGGNDCIDDPADDANAAQIYPGHISENTAALCGDGINNDCDAEVDCYDPDCRNGGGSFCPQCLQYEVCVPGNGDSDCDHFPDCDDLDCIDASACSPDQQCASFGVGWFIGNDGRTCVPPECHACYQNGGTHCDQGGNCLTPIMIDMDGDGFDLTNAANGVMFRPSTVGRKIRMAWTSVNSDDVLLVLDRNGNGKIDNGSELFGCATPQPHPPPGEIGNGFIALAEYDKPANGGNKDGRIDRRDGIFDQLRLWRDSNHNGRSKASELQKLSNSEIRVLELNYRESRRQDQHGNKFKYRAKVRDKHGAQVGRWAWDVFPTVQY